MRAAAVIEVYTRFTTLGLVAFGGPTAHLALFRSVFAGERGWLSEARYDSLMALCQFLPGPGSSQLAAALGHERAGRPGALAAMAGFATPSMIVMGLAGWAATAFSGLVGAGVVGGLLAAAAGVVANAVLAMARTQAQTAPGAGIALAAFIAVLSAGFGPIPLVAAQPLVIALGAAAGAWSLRTGPAPRRAASPGGLRNAAAWLVLFAAPLIALPLLAGTSEAATLADAAYRAGALVFGGGHVVLPLLQAGMVPELVDQERFLAGYGLAQAIPGPLFTFSAFLGAAAADHPAQAAAFAALAGAAIFAPGLLLVHAALPVWSRLEQIRWARAGIAGAAAAVTGVLAAALIDPVILSVPREPVAYAIVAAAFVALRWGKISPPLVIFACGGAGWALL